MGDSLFMLITLRESSSLGALVQQFPNMLRSFETGKRLMALLEEEAEPDSEHDLEVNQGQVVFENVNFSYEENKPVLRDISIRAEKVKQLLWWDIRVLKVIHYEPPLSFL